MVSAKNLPARRKGLLQSAQSVEWSGFLQSGTNASTLSTRLPSISITSKHTFPFKMTAAVVVGWPRCVITKPPNVRIVTPRCSITPPYRILFQKKLYPRNIHLTTKNYLCVAPLVFFHLINWGNVQRFYHNVVESNQSWITPYGPLPPECRFVWTTHISPPRAFGDNIGCRIDAVRSAVDQIVDDLIKRRNIDYSQNIVKSTLARPETENGHYPSSVGVLPPSLLPGQFATISRSVSSEH